MLLCGGGVQQRPEQLRRSTGFALLPADVHFQQDILHDAGLGGFLLDGQQQMLTVHALDQACPPQHLFDLIGLQVADKMAGLAAVSPGIVVCTQLLHMVLAEHINGQGGTGCYGLRRAGLAGGAQLHRCRIASGFPGSGCHLFPDLCHGLPHLFQILFCHLAQSSSV